MALLTGKQLHDVVLLLRSRYVFFYHACQLQDFRTYIKLGGIPSRNLMETSGLPYTQFDTDAKDHQNGVWPKIFGNLSDFGQGFAIGQWSEGTAPTPNPYGPILLVAHPDILLKAEDVAICLRSAGGRDFNREAESLSSAGEIDRLFVHPADAQNQTKRAYIKYTNQLRQEFGGRYAYSGNAPSTYNPEISCSIENECLPLDKLSFIIVDRYHMCKQSLLSRVASIAFTAGLRVEIMERRYRGGRWIILNDLSRLLIGGVTTATQLKAMTDVHSDTRVWAERIIAGDLSWQYLRFASYLREGTLSQCN
jgi:hypothetical protein